MSPPPVFICGPARSGTTLLVRLLDSHPDLAVFPEETYLYQDLLLGRRLSWFVVHLAELFDLPNLPGILSRSPLRSFAFAGHDRLRARLHTWVQSFDSGTTSADVIDAVIRDTGSGDSYWQAFLEVYERLVPGTLATRRYWVEKTPSNERFIALHERAFAGRCRYLHVLRDPRDVAASWLKRRRDTAIARDRTLVRICYLWSLSVHRCAWGLRTYPARYHALRYEDLVQRPRDIMQGICIFLGIAMTDRMLTPTKLGAPVALNSSYSEHESTFDVTSSQIGRFPEVLTEADIRFVEGLLRNQMAACGYVPAADAATDVADSPPPLPAGARRAWTSRAQVARAWRFQRKLAGRSLSFGSLSNPPPPTPHPTIAAPADSRRR